MHLVAKPKRYTKRLKRLFPLHIRNVVNFDDQGLYSTTEYEIAQKMTDIMVNACWLHTHEQAARSSIVDGTAGIGGNTFSFCTMFKRVYAMELDYTRWIMLHLNMKTLEMNNTVDCIHGNFLTYLEAGLLRSARVFFLDPPWGGLSYKRKAQVHLCLSGTPLHVIVNSLPADRPVVCGIKVPYNFALGHFSERLAKHVHINSVNRFRQVWLVVCYLYPPSASPSSP